ncbi:MAG TPA: hypothetical protein GXX34_00575 [Clostridia bacterium]|nr:hypothetical protein [Clostridia bacterium]
MNILPFLMSQQKSILAKWFDAILADYPSETALFLKNNSDPFNNPVGYTFRQGIEALWTQLVQSQISEEMLKAALEPLIKIRAVQDFPPGRAVGFLLYLKRPVRELLAETHRETIRWQELAEFEERIDLATLLAFEVYSNCREQLYAIRIKELKNSIPKIYQDAVLRQCDGYQAEGSEG